MTAPESVRDHLPRHELAAWDALWRRLLAPLPDDPEPEDDTEDDGELPEAA